MSQSPKTNDLPPDPGNARPSLAFEAVGKIDVSDRTDFTVHGPRPRLRKMRMEVCEVCGFLCSGTARVRL